MVIELKGNATISYGKTAVKLTVNMTPMEEAATNRRRLFGPSTPIDDTISPRRKP